MSDKWGLKSLAGAHLFKFWADGVVLGSRGAVATLGFGSGCTRVAANRL